MPPKIDSPPAWTNGHFTTSTGVLVPPSASRSIGGLRSPNVPPQISAIIQRGQWGQDLWEKGLSWGFRVEKDKDTGAVLLPQKGSGMDDLLNAALVDGELANVGISSILSSQISSLLNKQISQASNSDIVVSGRKSPVRKATDAISFYNDSPLGYVGAVRQVIYQMRVFNRGAPHATIPIMYPVDQWGEMGLMPVPMPKANETEETARTFYLEVDWERHGQPIPSMPSVFDLEATGDSEWPFWYSFYPRNDNKRCWILLHWTQIIGCVPAYSLRRGIGSSSAWLCWDFLIDLALERQRRAERLQHEPSNGIVAIGGTDMKADQIGEHIFAERELNKAKGMLVNKGFTIIAGKEAINIDSLFFREAPAEFEEFRQWIEDNIAHNFEEALVALVTRGGIGYGVQSDEAQKGSADAGVHSVLTCIAQILGQIYPRVQISIIRPNDFTKRQQLENLDTLARAVSALPAGTLTPEEVRALIPMTGISIPLVGEGEMSQKATADESDQDTDDGADGEQQPVAEQDEMSRRIDALVLEAEKLGSWLLIRGVDEPIPDEEPEPEQHDTDLFDEDFPEFAGLLDAAVSDAAEAPRSDRSADRDEWLWLVALLLYQRVKDGRQVDKELAIEMRSSLAGIRQSLSLPLAADLYGEQITLAQWTKEMRFVTSEAYTHQYMLGRGGRNSMEAADWDWLRFALVPQFALIGDLAGRIAQGLYTEAQAANFSGNIIRQSLTGYEAGNGRSFRVDIAKLPAMPCDGSTECMSSCHCHWEHIIEDGTWVGSNWVHPPFAARRPGWEPCRTCEFRINNWQPWRPGMIQD